MTARPLIVFPDKVAPHDRVLVAYDGSPSAIRAVQMFALLDIERDKSILVVSFGAAIKRALSQDPPVPLRIDDLPEAADLILQLIRDRGAKPTLAANQRAASVSASPAGRGE